MPTAPTRAGSGDRCPGALRLHAAGDGHVARIRVPGGRLTSTQLIALCQLAESLGDGDLHVTSRGNLQVRGLSAAAGSDVATALQDAGLLPSLAHDRVRNVVASPFGGAAVDAALAAFDRALVADERLADLSGRFLFGIDDGTGDILSLRPDLTAVPHQDGWHLLVDGHPSDLVGPASQVLVEGAHRFLEVREDHAPDAWRVTDLTTSGRDEIRGLGGTTDPGENDRTFVHSSDNPAGQQPLVTVWVPLGVAPSAAWMALAELAGRVRVTPWRSVVLVDVRDAEAAAALQGWGFLQSADEPLARTTACIGRPGCARALTEVRRDARLLADQHPGRLHVSGCERRCGHPSGLRTEATAQAGGHYLIEELT